MWPQLMYSASKTQKISLRYYCSQRHAIKHSGGQMRQISRRMEMIHPTIESQKRTRLVDISDLHHVFARKQCILCPALRHSCLTLLYVTSFRDFFYPWNNRAQLYYAAASHLREAACWQLWVNYCNYPLANRQGDRFASCEENIVSRSQTSSLPPARFTLYARKLYRTELLFTHKSGDFAAISVKEQSWAAPIS